MKQVSSSTIKRQQSFTHALNNFNKCLMCNQDFMNLKRHFAGCQHDLSTCYSCFSKYIDQKMQLNEVLTCPYCPAQILLTSQQYSTLFKHLPDSKQRIIKKYIGSAKSIGQIWICPDKSCGGRIPNQICQKCGRHYCPKCKQKQHPFDTCPNSGRTSTSSNPNDKYQIICQKCGRENIIKKKDIKKKVKACQNQYCNSRICIQHRTLWTINHDNHHPLGQRLYVKPAECGQCLIY